MLAITAVCGGAALGALLRWGLSVLLNAVFPPLPLGTLIANLLGGYLIGLAMGAFSDAVPLSPEWRLFIATGFLGGLTTFSTFSAEVTSMLQAGHFATAFGATAAHVMGSLGATFAGLSTYTLLAR